MLFISFICFQQQFTHFLTNVPTAMRGVSSSNAQLRRFGSPLRIIPNYKIHVCESVVELFAQIEKSNRENSLCKVVTGPGWKINDDIVIDGNIYHWTGSKKRILSGDSMNTISSIHKIQGFDLNVAGVIFGKEIRYDLESKRLEINKQELMDNFTKSNGDEEMRQYVLNIYLTLMTRGISATYVYAVDKNLRDYLKQFFD